MFDSINEAMALFQDAARGALIWSSADFDPNDNVVRTIDPRDGPATGDPGGGFATTTTYDAMDRPKLTTGPDSSADQAGERTQLEYDAAGRVVKITEPKTPDYSSSGSLVFSAVVKSRVPAPRATPSGNSAS